MNELKLSISEIIEFIYMLHFLFSEPHIVIQNTWEWPTRCTLFLINLLQLNYALHSCISNFRLVLNVACFLLGDSPASEFYIPTFRITVPVPSSYLPACEDGTDGVFRNVGMYNSDAGELPRRKHTISCTCFEQIILHHQDVQDFCARSMQYFTMHLWSV